MAEYINKEDLKFLEIPIAPIIQGEQVHYEQGFLKEWLESVHTADVIERSEYEKLLKENEELKEIATNCIEADSQSCEELTKLHSKIDNAIEEIEQAIKECKLRWAVTGMEHALGILKRSIGE